MVDSKGEYNGGPKMAASLSSSSPVHELTRALNDFEPLG